MKKKFNMRNSVRSRIEKEGLYQMMTKKKSAKIPLIIGIVWLIGVAIFLFFGPLSDYPLDSDEFLLPAVLLALPGFPFIIYALFTTSSTDTHALGLKLIETHYGNPQEVLAEIDTQIRQTQGEIPATSDKGYFTVDWFIGPDYGAFVKLKDIICVIGIMGRGTTAVITIQGERIESAFGGNPNWGRLFQFIEKANPNVMTVDDEVTFEGKRVRLDTLFDEPFVGSVRKGSFADRTLKLGKSAAKKNQAVLAEYLKRHG